MLRLSDIKLPEGVEIPELAQEDAEDRGIVSVHHIRIAEVEEEAEVEELEAVEGEAVEGEAAEGEAAEAEGGTPAAEGGGKSKE